MRKIFTFLLAAMCFTLVQAQEIQSLEKTMSLGKQQAIYVEVEGADKDLVEDVWKDYMKEYGKTKRNKKAKEYYSEGLNIPMIASGGVDLYTKFDEGSGQATVYLWVVNNGEFVEDSDGAENFLSEYYVMARKKVINEEIKDQEKLLKKLGKNLEKLEKKNKGYHNDIAKAEDKIRKAEENIERNLQDQQDTNMEIEQQKKNLEEMIEKLNNVGKQ